MQSERCEVCDVSGKRVFFRSKYNKVLCNRHYLQLLRHGRILPRTSRDGNEIVLYDDYAEIVMYDKNNKEKGRAIIDIDCVDDVKKYKWMLYANGYVAKSSPQLYLHRFLMDCPKGLLVDHINHNPLDNRKSNLRIVTKQQNQINCKKRTTNTSGHKGISWSKSERKWEAQIGFNGKHMNLGKFKNIDDAIAARKKAEEKYFGEYAYKETV